MSPDKPYKTILFDFDGTITPSLNFWIEAFHFAFATYDIRVSDETVTTRCFYREFDVVAKDFGIKATKDFDQKVREGLLLAFEKANLFPSIFEVLEKCYQASLGLGVVTSNTKNLVHKVLAQLKVHKYFGTVVCYEDCKRLKPFPDPIFLALNRLGADASSALIIGDSSADILSGKAARIATGLFIPEENLPHVSVEKLKASDPDFTFSHHNELLKHLEPSFCHSQQAT